MPSSWDLTPVPATGAKTAPVSSWDATPSVLAAKLPFDDPGVLQSILIGAGRTFDRVGKGAQQVYYGMTGNDAKQTELAQIAAADDAAYRPLQEAHPFATGTGEALPSMIIPAGGGATLGANILRQAGAAALPSALSYGSARDRLQSAGWNAVSGAAAPALGVVGKSAYAAAEPFWQGGQNAIVGRTLNRVAGSEAAAVAQRLAGAAPVIPGSLPTAAQVAENGGIAALERSASAVNPTDYTARAMEQAGARKAALESIAGTPQDLQTAISMRANAAEPWYGLAKRSSVDVTPQISNILDRLPSSAKNSAEEIARMNGEPIGTLGISAADAAPGILAAGGDALPIPPTIGGNALHYLKLGMDDSIASAKIPTSGVGPAQLNALGGLNDSFNGILNTQLPGYQTARTIFADTSRPVNQMQIGRALADKLSPALSDFGALGKETGARYAAALREGDQMAQQATGFPGASTADVMTQPQMDLINGVGTDLAGKANAQDLGRGVGSDTIQKLAMQNIAAQSGMPSAMGALTSIGGKTLSLAYGNADEAMARQLANALLNPQQAANLMTSAAPSFMAGSPALRNALAQTLLRTGMLGAPAASAANQVLAPALTAE